MRLGKYLTTLTKPELEEIRELLNLTNDEEVIVNILAKGRSREEIALKLQMSVPTVDRRMCDIKNKLKKLGVKEWE